MRITENLPKEKILSLENLTVVTFKCEARSSSDRPVITWKHKEKSISTNNLKFAMNETNLTDGSNDFIVQSFLTIFNPEVHDSGSVECIAETATNETDRSQSMLFFLGGLFIYLFIYLFVCLFICLFVCLFVYLCVYLFIYLFIYLFVWILKTLMLN